MSQIMCGILWLSIFLMIKRLFVLSEPWGTFQIYWVFLWISAYRCYSRKKAAISGYKCMCRDAKSFWSIVYIWGISPLPCLSTEYNLYMGSVWVIPLSVFHQEWSQLINICVPSYGWLALALHGKGKLFLPDDNLCIWIIIKNNFDCNSHHLY